MMNGSKESFDVAALVFDFSFEFPKFGGQNLVAHDHFAESNECAHNGYIDLDGSFAIQDAAEHGHALFGKYIRHITAPTSF